MAKPLPDGIGIAITTNTGRGDSDGGDDCRATRGNAAATTTTGIGSDEIQIEWPEKFFSECGVSS